MWYWIDRPEGPQNLPEKEKEIKLQEWKSTHIRASWLHSKTLRDGHLWAFPRHRPGPDFCDYKNWELKSQLENFNILWRYYDWSFPILRACVLSCFSHVRLWARQAPLSMRLSRQEYWSGLPCSPPRDLPNPGIEPRSPAAAALHTDSLPLSHQGSPPILQWLLNTSNTTSTEPLNAYT